jgi:hypothetical protein
MKRSRGRSAAAWGAALVLVGLVAGEASAQRVVRPPRGAVGPGGAVNLPFMVNDNKGNNWRVYQGGWIQQQGNQPLYSQGAQITVNGNPPNMNNNQARLDEKTGELIFENMDADGIAVTRRVLVDREQGLVRYIDILKNTGAQPAQVQVQIQSNFNYGFQSTQPVEDPRRKGQELAWVAQSGAGPSIMEVYAGKGAKNVFQITGQAQNNFLQATISPTIPAGKEVALMHLHGVVPTVDAGVQFVKGMKEAHLLRSIPREIRKLIINFATGQNYIGDVEILRGDLLDVVELKGGDQFKGTLRETSFALETFYGKVELPVEQVIGLINVGRFRPRQLVITSDGQIFGGRLSKETIDLELSSKQVTKIPLAQVARMGYRKRDGEPEEWTFDKPLVLMRTGERVGVQMPIEPVTVLTRYGKLALKPETIASVVLQAEEHGVHEVLLTDGSRFAGLVDAASFPMKLEAGAAAAGGPPAAQEVTFPASGVARLQFSGKVAEPDEKTPTLVLNNEDVLVGTLAGRLAVDTAFDTIEVTAEEIRSLTHPTAGSLDVSVTLWDGSTLSGQLQDQELSCKLVSGATMRVPVALVREYQQPQPAPSGQMVERIKAVVLELNADDWKQRDRAEATLVGMGSVAAGILRELKASQPPEAQQRIDSVLKQLEKLDGSSAGAPEPAAEAGPAEPEVELQIEN